MPRTTKEILEHADQLAARFEDCDPDGAEIKDAASLRAVRLAFQGRAEAERLLAGAVSAARADGHSWSAIGAMVATSGEAARQRYGSGGPDAGTPLSTELAHASRRAITLPHRIRTRGLTRTTSSGGTMPSERTGKKAASNAGKTLGAKKGKSAARSASGSALSQRKSSGVTGKKAASNARKTLGAKKTSKVAKSVAGSALTQKPATKSVKAKKNK